MTTTSTRPGGDFSLYSITPNVDGLDGPAMARAIVDRFHELAADAGDPTIYWCPRTAEVQYECISHGPLSLRAVHRCYRDLDDMRKQAVEEVWDRAGRGEFDICDATVDDGSEGDL